MSLQRRLTLFFVFIVVLTIGAAAYAVQQVISDEHATRTEMALSSALDANVVVYDERLDSLEQRIRLVASEVGSDGLTLDDRDPARAQRSIEDALAAATGLDFVVLLDRQGSPRASVLRPGRFASGIETPATEDILAVRPGRRFQFGGGQFVAVQAPITVSGRGRVGTLIAGFWLDGELLQDHFGDVDVFIVSEGRTVASTGAAPAPARLVARDYEETFEADIGEGAPARAVRLRVPNTALVAALTSPDGAGISRALQLSLAGLFLFGLLATGGLAYFLARLITQPLEELARGAHAVAQGRFEHRIPISSTDEVGRLAVAFNDMTDHLRDTVGQLSSSRDQLRRTVRRIGETLRATNDMKQMLQSILNTASDAVRSDAAILWTFTASRDQLYPAYMRGVDSARLGRVDVGEGIVGLVAERATTLMLPDPNGGPMSGPAEPDMPVVIAVPLYSQNRIKAVLTTYRSDETRPFSPEDLDTVVFLAEQAGVAIENVLLHEEAQRLSLTDGLTGIWNRRYFQMQSRQVLATAQRFDRPFSVLMLDLDRFKRINDTYGHQRGDSILVEFAQRVSNVLREVDTFARYGGEEFVCLLSETDVYGGARTAEKILHAIRSVPFGSLDDEPLQLTVSIGVASYPEHGDTFRTLIDAADQALYRAKQEGRDRSVIAETGPATPGLKIAR